jgi:hypothetical protein
MSHRFSPIQQTGLSHSKSPEAEANHYCAPFTRISETLKNLGATRSFYRRPGWDNDKVSISNRVQRLHTTKQNPPSRLSCLAWFG